MSLWQLCWNSRNRCFPLVAWQTDSGLDKDLYTTFMSCFFDIYFVNCKTWLHCCSFSLCLSNLMVPACPSATGARGSARHADKSCHMSRQHGKMIDDASFDRWESPPLFSWGTGCLEKGWEFKVKTGTGWTPGEETKTGEERGDGMGINLESRGTEEQRQILLHGWFLSWGNCISLNQQEVIRA